MSRALACYRVAPGVTVQDLGRPGYLVEGLSRGGAVDPLALYEGAALLGQDPGCAAVEMPGAGGEFSATEDLRIALTGAPMRATLDGEALAWNASHRLPAGAQLAIGPATGGSYGYLHVGGGVALPDLLGARSAHLAAGLGAPLQAGQTLPVGPDPHPRDTGLCLPADDRFAGGPVRVVPSLQTDMFADSEIARFEATRFTRDPRSNRMGVRLATPGAGFGLAAGLTVLSEVIVPGDIQITGDGTPVVLLAECQTVGGYPRIGAVLPADLPRVAQAPAGAVLSFRFVSLADGLAAERQHRGARDRLRSARRPLLRDPATIRDLLAYQLVSGVTAGDDLDRPDP